MIPNELHELADAIAAKVAVKLAANPRNKRLLTAQEAAEYIGRTPEAVQKMAQRGELPTVRAGRRVHYDIRALDRWIEENSISD